MSYDQLWQRLEHSNAITGNRVDTGELSEVY